MQTDLGTKSIPHNNFRRFRSIPFGFGDRRGRDCGILVTVEDDQVTRIEGNPDDVLSQGYICPKATAMGGLHHDPDRLRTPVRRVEPTGNRCLPAQRASITLTLAARRRQHIGAARNSKPVEGNSAERFRGVSRETAASAGTDHGLRLHAGFCSD
ncbi:hypothetical protein OG563_42155 [Nocardia vinacea]|uniref:4Fe-4S Mo/W bis-MGD-type domain-containing protein n=1 Tax=Nocardia vinacea TaxID=96468 RepID=A0ABZ1YQV8_9NOCA|nr:hypothetical protein [Nocardia vinacea]